MERALRGSCSCGRNRYVIEIPQSSTEGAQIVFDNSNLQRRLQAAPFCAWLVVPLDWYSSATYAYFPDESHNSIRRTFTSFPDTTSRRQFCGYCGTPLTTWNDRSLHEANNISVTLGSLLDEDLGKLENLGLLSLNEPSEEEEVSQERAITAHPVRSTLYRGAPWFEEIIQGSSLGTIKRQKGGHTSRDGTVTVEWEVVEWTGDREDDSRTSTPGKRKLADITSEGTDVDMRGT